MAVYRIVERFVTDDGMGFDLCEDMKTGQRSYRFMMNAMVVHPSNGQRIPGGQKIAWCVADLPNDVPAKILAMVEEYSAEIQRKTDDEWAKMLEMAGEKDGKNGGGKILSIGKGKP